MSGPYTEAIKQFSHWCQSTLPEPVFPQITGLVPCLMSMLHWWALPVGFCEHRPFAGQDRHTPEAVIQSRFIGGDFYNFLGKRLAYTTIRDREPALSHVFPSSVVMQECVFGFDHCGEAVPSRMWQWSYDRSFEVWQSKGGWDKCGEWKCWAVMPSSRDKVWASGALDKNGNPSR